MRANQGDFVFFIELRPFVLSLQFLSSFEGADRKRAVPKVTCTWQGWPNQGKRGLKEIK